MAESSKNSCRHDHRALPSRLNSKNAARTQARTSHLALSSIEATEKLNACLAQLDRASDFDSEGWGFESLGARQPSPCGLRLGKPAKRRNPQGEGCHAEALAKADWLLQMKYVYILQSISDPERFYVGITNDVDERLLVHNSNHVPHTSKFGPWRVKTFVAFTDEKQAFAFEKYLKSASGRAFAKKRF
jgi:putative endonuclease